MKKKCCPLMTLALCLSLAACGGSPSSTGGAGSVENSTPVSSAPVESSAPSTDETESEPAETPDAPDDAAAGAAGYEEYAVLGYIEPYAAPSAEELAGTMWEFAGGFTEGRDMEAEEASTVLEVYGGMLQVAFAEGGKASMTHGYAAMSGTYSVLEDGITVPIVFDYEGTQYGYAAVFTVGGENNVMVLLNTADPSMAFYMTQTDAAAASDGAAADGGIADAAGYEEYSVLGYVEVYAAPSAEELAGTGWEFAGGFTADRDMEAEEANAVLEMYGGKLQVVFMDSENASMVQGSGAMSGVYGVLEDGITVPLLFEYNGTQYGYVAVFTVIDESNVMVLISTAEPSTAFYMTQIDER